MPAAHDATPAIGVGSPDRQAAANERIVIEAPRFVGLRLTPAAYRRGLARALPDAGVARPTGDGHAIAAYDMPIEGRDEWLAAAARHPA